MREIKLPALPLLFLVLAEILLLFAVVYPIWFSQYSFCSPVLSIKTYSSLLIKLTLRIATPGKLFNTARQLAVKGALFHWLEYTYWIIASDKVLKLWQNFLCLLILVASVLTLRCPWMFVTGNELGCLFCFKWHSILWRKKWSMTSL